MSDTKRKLKAFPRSFNGDDGMSLRDYFAAKALASIASGYHEPEEYTDCAVTAYQMADAMLKAR